MQAVLTRRLNPTAAEFYRSLGTTLNPAAAVSYPVFRHCHEKHVDRGEARVSKYQIRRNEAADAG